MTLCISKTAQSKKLKLGTWHALHMGVSVIILGLVGLCPKGGFMDLVLFLCLCVRVYVRNHISGMYGPILFVLGTKTTHDGIHMHIIFIDIRPKMACWRPF